jgi:hypothetical protein
MAHLAPVHYRVRAFPGQRKYFNLPQKYKGYSGPVGCGKTHALCYEVMQMATVNAGRRGLVGAPTYPMLRDVTIPSLLDLLEKHHVPFRYLKQENSLVLKRSQSRIIFRALEHYERLRGSNLAWFAIDELTYCRKEAWERLEARLRDPKATRLCGFAVWTPKGFDWVYDRFLGPDRIDTHEAVLAGQAENMAVLEKNPSYYEDMKKSYDELFYRQECLGEYLNVFSGRVYHSYDGAIHDEALEYSPHRPLGWAIDFNLEPMCSVLLQDFPGRAHALDELALSACTTQNMAERVYDRIQPYIRIWQDHHGSNRPFELALYGDAAGNSKSTKAYKSDYDIIREFYRSKPEVKLVDHTIRANPGVKDRVNAVNVLLKDASGKQSAWIDKRCKELRTDFLKVAWMPGADGYELDKKSDKRRTHMSDAFGYFVYQEHRVDGFHREHISN